MSYAKQFPIRVTLDVDACNLLIEALKGNEEDFEGSIAEEAKGLREKIENYGRRETDANGEEIVRLGFYEKEGVKFIRQFLAAAKMAAEYRELLDFSDTVCAEYDTSVETEV
ncbi:MAG: hypothetical protein LBK75_10260 [Oscillospiraceae bacterium]|jgi:hypothetical protein|nr:hypothetical protein [Oscillospiraceae bacterium]